MSKELSSKLSLYQCFSSSSIDENHIAIYDEFHGLSITYKQLLQLGKDLAKDLYKQLKSVLNNRFNCIAVIGLNGIETLSTYCGIPCFIPYGCVTPLNSDYKPFEYNYFF